MFLANVRLHSITGSYQVTERAAESSSQRPRIRQRADKSEKSEKRETRRNSPKVDESARKWAWVRWSAASAAGVAGFLWCPPALVADSADAPLLAAAAVLCRVAAAGRCSGGASGGGPPLRRLGAPVVAASPLGGAAVAFGALAWGCCVAGEPGARSALTFLSLRPPWPGDGRGQRR